MCQHVHSVSQLLLDLLATNLLWTHVSCSQLYSCEQDNGTKMLAIWINSGLDLCCCVGCTHAMYNAARHASSSA